MRVMRQPGPGCESLMSWCRGRGQRLSGDLRPPPPLSLSVIWEIIIPGQPEQGHQSLGQQGIRAGLMRATLGTAECHHSQLSPAAVKTLILLEMRM